MTGRSGQGGHAARAGLCWVLVLLLVGGQTSSSQVRPPYPLSPKHVRGLPAFDIVSDTQTPLWFEKFRVKADGNETIPGRIFEDIAQDSTVVAVFHLGDLTALGSLGPYWEDFDDKAACVREAHIPIYPAFGNH